LLAGIVALAEREKQDSPRIPAYRGVHTVMRCGTDLCHATRIEDSLTGGAQPWYLPFRRVGHRWRCAIQIIQSHRFASKAVENCTNYLQLDYTARHTSEATTRFLYEIGRAHV